MKKVILTLVLAFSFALAACEPSTPVDDGPKQCIPGYEDVDGKCELIVPECTDDEILVDNVCVEKNLVNVDYPGPIYQSQGYDDYEGRDLVTSECSHLDNIGEWQPVWCDEFDYETPGLPDTSKWGYDVGGNGGGNNELQYYTNADPDNVFVRDGLLTITSIKEYLSGKNYTSTRLVSRDKGDFLYGKIQVRAKVPAGTGTWPAIWMLPTDWSYGGWPYSGEIDIMEYVGYDPNKIHTTIHTGAFNHSLHTQVGKTTSVSTVEEEFHVYEIEWEPNAIRFYLNGELIFTTGYNPATMSNLDTHDAWPFDQRFHLLINTAIGGDWGGVNGVDDSIFPVEFQIDYVRVYQKDYAGMDNEAPDAVTNLRAIDTSASSAFLGWNIATDDVLVKEYKVYQDDVLLDTVSHNGHLFDGLDANTTYEFKVVAVDFAGNEGTPTTLSITTPMPTSFNDRVEAEDYASMSGIELETAADTGGGKNVGYIDSGDYLTYTLYVPEAGTYTMRSRVASNGGSGGFNFSIDNGVSLVDVAIPNTGGWQNWQTVTSQTFYLSEGTYTFKITALDDGFNLNYFEFDKIS